ncbi:MAG: hypothetical protein CMK03_14945 [Ponticaulis sp.]|nr:hypothetical protein [Ponticaulis sp.]
MNGRIYDPTLGRFLQADPHIQAPTNSQNYNRYSYVLNNPLSYTDPSGYFFKKLFKGIKKYWRVIAAAAISIATYGTATGWAAGWLAGTSLAGSQIAIGAIAGGITGFVGGGVASGSLRGALNGALSGAAFGAVGGSFKAYGVENVGVQMGAHAVAGGILSDLQGGNFGHGFFTAGVMKGFGKINFGDMNVYGRTVIQAMVGGTVSKLTGGKFANGAVTAAIQFVVNEKSGWIKKQWDTMKKSFSIIGKEAPKYVDDVKEQMHHELIEDKRLVKGLNEISRWSGHGASACAVALQPECAGPLGAVSLATGATATAMDMLIYKNDSAPLGLVAEGVSDYSQKGFVNMLPAPMRTPANIAFELQQTVTRETMYHVGQ